MKNLFIFNIGNSDVQFKSNPIAGSIQKGEVKRIIPARVFGKELWDEKYNRFKDDASVKKAIDDGLFFPIVSSTLEVDGFTPAESKIILFVTNQESENSQDTIYYGKIIKRCLEFIYKDSSVELTEVNENPADMDIMKDFYRKALAKIAEENRPFDHVFASLTGGTQAQNMMLLICGLSVFREKFRTLYTSVLTRKTKELTITKDLFKTV